MERLSGIAETKGTETETNADASWSANVGPSSTIRIKNSSLAFTSLIRVSCGMCGGFCLR